MFGYILNSILLIKGNVRFYDCWRGLIPTLSPNVICCFQLYFMRYAIKHF